MPYSHLIQEINERKRVSELLEQSSRTENSLRERLEATSADADVRAHLASTRSELEAVSLERDALVGSAESE